MNYFLSAMWIVLLFVNFFIFGVVQQSGDLIGSIVSFLTVVCCGWCLYRSLFNVVRYENNTE